MTIFLYDQTFEGLLTAVFDAYSRKSFPDSIFKTGEPLPLFYDEVYTVVTDYEKAERVWKLLVRKLSKGALTTLTYSWLSEAPDIAMLLFRYIRKITDAPRSIETNFADPDILAVTKLGKKLPMSVIVSFSLCGSRRQAKAFTTGPWNLCTMYFHLQSIIFATGLPIKSGLSTMLKGNMVITMTDKMLTR